MVHIRTSMLVPVKSTTSSLTISVHTDVKALVETTSSALVPVYFVDRTMAYHSPMSLAGVFAFAVDTSLEETRTT